MNKQTFTFYSMGGIIPSLPDRTFGAGTAVDVDMDTMTVLAERSLNLPPDIPAVATPEPREPLISDEDEELAQDAPQGE